MASAGEIPRPNVPAPPRSGYGETPGEEVQLMLNKIPQTCSNPEKMTILPFLLCVQVRLRTRLLLSATPAAPQEAASSMPSAGLGPLGSTSPVPQSPTASWGCCCSLRAFWDSSCPTDSPTSSSEGAGGALPLPISSTFLALTILKTQCLPKLRVELPNILDFSFPTGPTMTSSLRSCGAFWPPPSSPRPSPPTP